MAVHFYEYTVFKLHQEYYGVIIVRIPYSVKANLLQALAGRTLSRKPLLVVSPKEPERTKQEYSCQHHQNNEKEAIDGLCR